jgi:hypothetical protein
MWGLFPRGWRCCIPALLASSALRFSLLLGNLLFSSFPLATTTISSLTIISKSHFPFFFEQQCRLFRSKREAQEKVSDFFETPAVGFLEPYCYTQREYRGYFV